MLPHQIFKIKYPRHLESTINIIDTIENGKCFIHIEGGELIETEIKNLPISSCTYVSGINGALLLDRYDGWLVLPAYNKGKQFIDYQLAVTGSPYVTESPTIASQREIAEEIGLHVEPNDMISCNKLPKFLGRDIVSHVWKPSIVEPSKIVCNKGRDNKQHKVSSYIIVDNPEQVLCRKRIVSTDKAGTYVVIMKISDARNIMKLAY